MLGLIHLHTMLFWIQRMISFCGVLIICVGIVVALFQYLTRLFSVENSNINEIRLSLGRVLTLGLEFIVAADLIGTTTAPDYYSVGILAIIVLIRTLLSYTLNREINSIASRVS